MRDTIIFNLVVRKRYFIFLFKTEKLLALLYLDRTQNGRLKNLQG